MIIEIYCLIGILFGIRFLYKEIRPEFGIVVAIFLAPLTLPFFAFVWPLQLISELPKAEKK